MRRALGMFTMLVVTIVSSTFVGLHAQSKRPLDHDVYDSWTSIQDEALSADGAWALFSLVPQEGDAELHVTSLGSDTAYQIPRGRDAAFTRDGRFTVFLIKPELAAVREAQKEKKKPEEQPKDMLGILDLSTGDVTRVERVESFKLPEEAGDWVAYLLAKPAEEADEDAADEAEEESREEGEAEREESETKDEPKETGSTLVLRTLSTGDEQRYDDVTEYAPAKNGRRLVFAASSEDGSADRVSVVSIADGAATTLLRGEGVYKSAVFDEAGEQVAFLSNRDDYEADQPAFGLYHWRAGQTEAGLVAEQGRPGVPDGWWVSEHRAPSFSDEGSRVLFGTAPRPEPKPDEETPDWEKVDLDVWNWKDPLLQPMQLVRRKDESTRTYLAVLQIDDGRIVQLADEALPTVTLGETGDVDVALGMTNMPYRQRVSWDSPGYNDVYAVDVASGQRTLVIPELQSRAALSPGGAFISWWDGHERAWYAASTAGGEPVNLTASIQHRFDNELHDSPSRPNAYGNAGWTDGDRLFVVYDKHDIWAIDPTGQRPPRNVTDGLGRAENLRFRYVRLDPDEEAIPPEGPLLLQTFDLTSKRSGFYHDALEGAGSPRELVMLDRALGRPRRAKDSDVLMLTRQSFEEFPDLWVSDPSFDDMRQISDANPQQADYRWGSSEIVTWTSTDGLPLEGILFTPDDFDPAKQYPLLVYFYEKNSDNLHAYRAPGPGGSSVGISFYVSRGYVVFVPDIHYRVGFPGESALNCVVPGVLRLVARGFIDPDRIGMQGHSWGGYQAAYMVTRTNIFTAVEAGAPVANMTSAYGGIRWGSGASRMMQYEKTQSRLGGSLWEARERYIENSPLFWADKIETPILMMHNDGDTAVPWYQGIELFVGLRRLAKPVWLVNYNGEQHGLSKYQNRKDFAIRMQQFFDHYLQDAPAPVWMSDGIPAVDKGKTLGLDLVEQPTRPTTGGRLQP